MLEIKNLHKSFGDREILKGVSLSLNQGEVTTIIGPSGTGKSTLLRSINVLERPEKGTITLNNRKIDYEALSKSDIHYLRSHTAMVFQNYNLFKNKTALENVMEPLVYTQHMPKPDAQNRAVELLQQVGLNNRHSAYPIQLSGGEQQRVGIARALAVNPTVLLLDEPTSSLDPELADGILKVIQDLSSLRIAMLIVTHEIKFAASISDTIIFMSNGKVVEAGPPKELFRSPREALTKNFLEIALK